MVVRHSFFFFNDTATTEIYTLSLHDALPIWVRARHQAVGRGELRGAPGAAAHRQRAARPALGRRAEMKVMIRLRIDRKSTRLNSSHLVISYAVFCLKKIKRELIEYSSVIYLS